MLRVQYAHIKQFRRFQMTYRKKRILLILFMAWLLGSCRKDERQISPTSHLNDPLPSFLSFVVPEPASTYSIEDFRTGMHYPAGAHPAPENARNRVCIELVSTGLLEPGDNFALYPEEGEFLPDRVTGYIDGKKAQKDEEIITILGREYLTDDSGEVVASSFGPQIICWPLLVERGIHYFLIEVTKTSGQIISYDWSFELVE